MGDIDSPGQLMHTGLESVQPVQVDDGGYAYNSFMVSFEVLFCTT
jgi:hypothetical protein